MTTSTDHSSLHDLAGEASSRHRPRIVFLNRSYWPDAEATGQLLTELAEDLAERFDITVIVGQPNRNPSGASYARRGVERRGGVSIRRVWHTTFPKHRLLGRASNFATFTLGAAWAAITGPKADVWVAETDPFLMVPLAAMVRRLRGGRLVCYLQDIQPDVGLAIGRLRPNPLLSWLSSAVAAACRSADRVIVLSRDMAQTVVAKGVHANRVTVLPNWSDTHRVRPVPPADNRFRRKHAPPEGFLVMHSGNMGETQQLEVVLDAADRLRDRSDLRFLLVGGGSDEPRLRRIAADRRLTNVAFLPYQPKEQLHESLSAADLHLISIDPRVVPLLMPSKLYGILAAGVPVVAVCPPECELADVIRDHGVGVVVPPNDPAALAVAVSNLLDDADRRAIAGRHARRLAETEFDRRTITRRFSDLLDAVLGSGGEASVTLPIEGHVAPAVARSPSQTVKAPTADDFRPSALPVLTR